MEPETTRSEFPNQEKGIMEQILASVEMNKSRTGLLESKSGIWKVNHLSKVI